MNTNNPAPGDGPGLSDEALKTMFPLLVIPRPGVYQVRLAGARRARA